MKKTRASKPPALTQNIIGIVYDFDGTLSPNNMQEDTIFRAYGINKDEFWAKADRLVKEKGYERTLAYLKLLIHDGAFRDKPLQREDLKALACQIEYYPGVKDYFDNLARFQNSIPEVEKLGITVEHYVVSSGMKEILEGADIYRFFKRVYACEYEYDSKGPVFPKLVINDTNKTQFLFRIVKGKLDLNEDVNSHMPDSERRIPFSNLLYIGDSFTDIPSMTVMQRYRGSAIAVFDPRHAVPPKVMDMVHERRADHFAPADYREGSLLIKIIHTALKKIIYHMAYDDSCRMSQDWVKRNKDLALKGSL
ncbi:MAG TPA: HAD family hydrolase [Verrucomicrobiae bacterium]|jgi:hypothetical protein|nr:HAD family hydrolase [Verrucomicrobiae bacterium]